MSVKAIGLINPVLTFTNPTTGAALAGGSVSFFTTGTSNLLAVYSDAAASVSLTNPVVLNAAGQTSTSSVGVATPVYLQSTAYDFTVKDSSGSVVYGPITVSGAWPAGIISLVTQTGVASANTYGAQFSPTINKPSSGTSSLFAGVEIDALIVGAGAGTVTNAASLVIAGAASGASTLNLALLISAGDAKFGGDVYTTVWTDWTTSASVSGWTSFTTKKVFYKRIGKMIYVAYYLAGTSNATTVAFTLPTQNEADIDLYFPAGTTTDSGSIATAPGLIQVSASSNLANIYRNQDNTSSWTNSGTKISAGTFWYPTLT